MRQHYPQLPRTARPREQRQMNPSRFQLPQYVSEDRRRARANTLQGERQRYQPKPDMPEGGEREGFRALPPLCAVLPPEAKFPSARFTELAADSVWSQVNGLAVMLTGAVSSFDSMKGYRAVFRVVRGPTATIDRWEQDAEFGRQRLTGVNPMHVRRLRERLPGHESLWEAASHVLRQRSNYRLEDLLAEKRLYYVDYPHLADDLVQRHLRPRVHLAAPTCYFWVDDQGSLLPLAIRLKPATVKELNPVFTPLSPYYDWMMARSHVQCADAHVHEGTYHLLETHLVSGAVALALYRNVHPDHPLRQLLDPHYEYTLAINELATGGLIAKGGTIDTALAAGVDGTLNAARMHYAKWSFFERTLEADLAERGVDEPDALPFYYYRDDGQRVYEALEGYVRSILSLWYRQDRDVAEDPELRAWTAEVSSPQGGVPGFPQSLGTREELFRLATELLFRAGPQHAAVNNGQFDAYGWIPNMPGMLSRELPTEAKPEGLYSEKDFWRAMPSRRSTLAQMGMVWVLSAPTLRTLMHSGESPAFHPSLCAEADEIIGSFRRQLASISDDIQRRNDTLDIPYRYMDPLNISRSTDI